LNKRARIKCMRSGDSRLMVPHGLDVCKGVPSMSPGSGRSLALKRMSRPARSGWRSLGQPWHASAALERL